jgi:hypothetical protein
VALALAGLPAVPRVALTVAAVLRVEVAAVPRVALAGVAGAGAAVVVVAAAAKPCTSPEYRL